MATVTLPRTPFMAAVIEAVRDIDRSIDARFAGIVDLYLVGGVAIHVYTQSRVSTDIDMALSHRIVLPPIVKMFDDGGKAAYVSVDRNYGEYLAVMHPDWRQDALRGGQFGRVRLNVISPLDLAVSKIARFAGNDQLDIRNLAMAGLIGADDVRQRFGQALDYYVGDPTLLRYNLEDAVKLVTIWGSSPWEVGDP